MELEQRTYLVEDVASLREQSRLLDEVVGEHERCELLQLRVLIAGTPSVEFLVVLLTVEATDDAQLHEVVAQHGVALE